MILSQIDNAEDFLFNRYMLLGQETFKSSLDTITNALIQKDILANTSALPDTIPPDNAPDNTPDSTPDTPPSMPARSSIASGINNGPQESSINNHSQESSINTFDELFKRYIKTVMQTTS